MAVDLYPYSGTRDGAVTDAEHESLWGGIPDGVLPEQPTNALAVSAAGSTWTAQPGKFRLAGHVLDVDVEQSGPLPDPASATRVSVVTAYIDRSQTPWAKGVRLVAGTPGGGRPNLSTSPTGVYEVALRAFQTAPSGAVTWFVDERPFTAGDPWHTYTPHWTNAGSADRFGVRSGRWRRVGPKHVVGRIYVTMAKDGTGASPVQTSLPTEPARGLRHALWGHAEDPAATLTGVTFTGGSGLWVDRILEVNSNITANLIGSRCMAGRLFTVHFDYEEA